MVRLNRLESLIHRLMGHVVVNVDTSTDLTLVDLSKARLMTCDDKGALIRDDHGAH